MTSRIVPRLRFKGFNKEWKKHSVKDISKDVIGGGTPKKSVHKYWINGSIPWIQSSDLKENDVIHLVADKHITREAVDNSGAQLIPKDSLAIVTRVGVGKLIIMPFKYATSQDFTSFSHLKINLYFGAYLMHIVLNKLKSVMQGSAIKGLSKRFLLKNNIVYPNDLSEQHQIGTFFAKLDRLISLQRQKIALLKKLKRGYLQKMFPRKGESVPRLRFEGFSGGWKDTFVKNLFRVTRGHVLAKKKITPVKTCINKYPVYSSQTSNHGLLGYYSKYLYNNAITWTTDGAGTVTFRKGKFYSTNVNGVLISSKGYANSTIANILNLRDSRYISYVGNPKLMSNTMKDIPIKISNIKEQQKISVFINFIENLINYQHTKLIYLQFLKKSYLQKMFC